MTLEFEHHLQMRVDELIDEGCRPDEARRLAEEAFGDLVAYRNACEGEQRREARMTTMRELLGNVLADVRFALRGMRAKPGFAASVIMTLGIGIGATTAIFAVVDTLLIRDLPFAEPDELYQVHAEYEGGFWVPSMRRSIAMDLANGSTEMGPLALAGRITAVRNDGPEPVTLNIEALQPGLSNLLGVPPMLGRPFNPDDAVPGAPRVVLLSHGFWSGPMGGDPEVVGRQIVLDDTRYEVVGVMPRSFVFPLYGTTQLYAPLATDGTVLGRPLRELDVILRVPESDFARVDQIAQARVAALVEAEPEQTGFKAKLVEMNKPGTNPSVRRGLYVTLAAVSLMLLVALVNGVNLLLVRGTTRAREIGVRLALGGSRGRVMAHLLTETLLLALASGGVAVLLSWLGVDLLWSMAPNELTLYSRGGVTVDGRVLLFAGALAGGSGLLFGLLPALASVRAGDATTSASLGGHTNVGRSRHRSRSLLVVLQVALSLTLLFAAALLGRSFLSLVDQDPGMEVEGLLAMDLQLSSGRYPSPESRAAFLDQVRERVAGIPGVTALTQGWYGLPGSGITFADNLYVEGQAMPVSEGEFIIPYATGDASLRSTLKTTLLAGRDFQPDDQAQRRVQISLSLARKLGAVDAGDAVGVRFRQSEDGRPYEVVGVVENVRLEGFDTTYPADALIRLMSPDAPEPYAGFLARVSGDPGPVMEAMRAAVLAADPGQPISSIHTVADSMRDSVQRPRFFLTLMTVFACVGLFLAGVGLYGVMSFTVSQRTREMGIRVALGAHTQDVRRLVMRGGLGMAAVGTALGAGAALASSRVLESLLFETSPRDVWALVGTASLLLATAALASYLPARRATRVNPVEVLKAE